METTEGVCKTTGKRRKSIKVWSETQQRFCYKSKNPNYYNAYFRKAKHPMTCELSGKTIACQMYNHSTV